jgi:hypothetical protein
VAQGGCLVWLGGGVTGLGGAERGR